MTRRNNNAAIFNRIWKEPTYLALHLAKDAIKPFSTEAGTEARREALARFDAACAAISDYETKAGIK